MSYPQLSPSLLGDLQLCNYTCCPTIIFAKVAAPYVSLKSSV